MRSADFVATLGVNTHIGSDPYNDPAGIASMLSYLAVGNVRQSSPIGSAAMSATQALGASGAKIDLIINGGGPVDLPGAMASVDQLAPYLNAVEGVNEAAIYPIQYEGIGGVDAAAALQKDLYAAVKADPALVGASVYMFTLGGIDPGAFPSLGDLSAYTDYANIHSYPPHGLRPIFVIHAAIDGGRTDAPSKPVVITETGFYTLPQNADWGGVPETMQASYLLDLVLDEAAAGVARTYLYDLIDDGPDPQQTNREDHFGLFHNDGTPKAAATAFHNMTTLLADSGASSHNFQTSDFSFSASGIPYDYTGNTMLLQKSDGTNIVAVWNEEQLWNPDTQTATPVQHFPVTVDLHGTYATVLVFDPTLGTDAIQTLHNVSTVNLDVTDHPLLVVIPPAPQPSGSIGGLAAPLTTVVLGSGPDVLSLTLSEDPYQGDAQFTISVDGMQVGGVQTTTAIRATGSTQTFDVLGSFGPGTHTATVDFLNDAWGGTPTADRNLFVTQASIDNTAIAEGSLAEFSGGPQSLTFQGAAAADTLTVGVSEDAWQGDAQYTVSVDGTQVGGIYTATASHAAGQINQQTISGSFGKGAHTVGVTFINDAWGGTAATDRNLYVNSVSYDGAALAMSTVALYSNGTGNIVTPAAANPDILTLHMAEAAYQGDAQFTVTIDGQQVGGTQTVTAPNASGATQAFGFASVLNAGSHDVAVSFLNALPNPDGSSLTGRNLYVAGGDLNGTGLSASVWGATLSTPSIDHFSLVVPS